MPRNQKQSPITVRVSQIDKEMTKVRKLIQDKTLRDFRSQEVYEAFHARQADKLYALNEELAALERPEDYNEIPLAVAAEELGITLNEAVAILRQGLLLPNSEARPSPASKITRDKLGKAIDIGSEELLRLARQGEEEVFFEGVQFHRDGDIDSAERCLDRIWNFRGYGRPYWVAT